ncbi:hypothetical protein IFM89_032731 [Coptis chinensis]|uniref:Uncharacterized protein n=1 Tax=Coptis chinensis TaxID=261450 RepID=A0A835HIE8_9MAGN|nr:hypothetical protein IFM89_032731 [Coptis chinensis]
MILLDAWKLPGGARPLQFEASVYRSSNFRPISLLGVKTLTRRQKMVVELIIFKYQQASNLVMQHVDHSAGDLIDLLQGLLRYDPAERLKARVALRHPFFTRDQRRCGYPL